MAQGHGKDTVCDGFRCVRTCQQGPVAVENGQPKCISRKEYSSCAFQAGQPCGHQSTLKYNKRLTNIISCPQNSPMQGWGIFWAALLQAVIQRSRVLPPCGMASFNMCLPWHQNKKGHRRLCSADLETAYIIFAHVSLAGTQPRGSNPVEKEVWKRHLPLYLGRMWVESTNPISATVFPLATLSLLPPHSQDRASPLPRRHPNSPSSPGHPQLFLSGPDGLFWFCQKINKKYKLSTH